MATLTKVTNKWGPTMVHNATFLDQLNMAPHQPLSSRTLVYQAIPRKPLNPFTMGRGGVNPDGSIHIRRPPNAFMLFRKDWSSHHRKALGLKNGEVSHATGEIWGRMPVQEKEIWEGLADKAKVAHELRYPDYVFKPKQRAKTVKTGKKKTKEEKTKGEKAKGPPRKRRRVDGPSTNSTMEKPPTRELSADRTLSIVPQEYTFTPPGSSSMNPAPGTEFPADEGEAVYAPSSFAAHNQPFMFHVPYIPAGPSVQPPYQANAAINTGPNEACFNRDYVWPTADVNFAHQTAFMVDHYSNGSRFEDAYGISAQFNAAHQTNFNETNVYNIREDYEWPSTGGFEFDLGHLREISNVGSGDYSGEEVQEPVYDNGSEFADAIASIYAQNAYHTAETLNAYYDGG